MRTTFADAFFYLALLNENDQAHELAVEVSETVSGHFITTAWPETDTSSKLVSRAILRLK